MILGAGGRNQKNEDEIDRNFIDGLDFDRFR